MEKELPWDTTEHYATFLTHFVKPRPNTQTPKAQDPVKISSKGTGADTKILSAAQIITV